MFYINWRVELTQAYNYIGYQLYQQRQRQLEYYQRGFYQRMYLI